jgi:hypothetical protein
MKDELTTNADSGQVAPPDAKHLLSAASSCSVRYWYGEIEKNKWSNLSVKARLGQLEHLQRCLDNAVCSCGGCR